MLGLTGPTGAGKSTVAGYFRGKGVPTVDADQAARRAVEPGSPALRELAAAFSPDILRPDGSLDRRRLAVLAFADRQSAQRLNGILHPVIMDIIRKELARLAAAGHPMLLLDAPQLYEAGGDALCNRVAAVLAPPGLRLARIMERDGLTEEEARRRMAAGLPDAFFREKGAWILENSGDKAALLAAAGALYRRAAREAAALNGRRAAKHRPQAPPRRPERLRTDKRDKRDLGE